MVRLGGEDCVVMTMRVSRVVSELIRDEAYHKRVSKREVVERAVLALLSQGTVVTEPGAGG